ncbi:hypothetical protein GCM10009539_38610 [Cryptosporangium japonicum]|uniref:Uncharacterized protein n=1 Tax=Cryptosporangium japonicum TaxID=80872 RepID=A0ABN0UGN4_9ACTN
MPPAYGRRATHNRYPQNADPSPLIPATQPTVKEARAADPGHPTDRERGSSALIPATQPTAKETGARCPRPPTDRGKDPSTLLQATNRPRDNGMCGPSHRLASI